MIRPLTCICLLLAGSSGLYLYQSKHRAQMLDREIESTLKATSAARDRIGVLRGEWALLNEPERLAALSQSHLGLKTLAPSQFVTAVELGARLPQPAAPGTTYAPEEESPVPTADALPQPPAPAASPVPAHPAIALARTPPVPPAAPPRSPVQVASMLQPPASPLPPPRPIAPHPVLASVVNVSASSIAALPGPKPALPRPAPSSHANTSPAVASPRPSIQTPQGTSIGESVARMARLQGGTQAASVTAPISQPAINPPASGTAIASVASVLGGVRPLLPPPIPFGSAMAAAVTSTR